MLRFLPFNMDVEKNLQPWRFTVMPYGFVCIPTMAGFCINNTSSKIHANVSPDTVHRVKNELYVDDCTTSLTLPKKPKEL